MTTTLTKLGIPGGPLTFLPKTAPVITGPSLLPLTGRRKVLPAVVFLDSPHVDVRVVSADDDHVRQIKLDDC